MTLQTKKHTTKEFIIPWLVLIVVLLSVGSFIWYTQFTEYMRIGIWEKERLATQTKVIEQNLVRQLEGVNSALEGIRNDIPYWQQKQGNWQRAIQRLIAMSDAMPGVRTFVITDAEGTVVAANRSQLIGKNFEHRDYFKTPRNNPAAATLYISPPFKTVFGVTSINLGRIITGSNGDFSGVVTASLSPEYFSILLGSILYSPDMHISIAHGDGKLFLQLPQNDNFSGNTFPFNEWSTLPETFLDKVNSSGKNYLVARQAIRAPGIQMDSPLIITIAREMQLPYQEWHEDTVMISLLFSGFALSLAGGLYLFQRRQRLFLQQTQKYEAELRQSAERFQKIASQVPGAIYQFCLYPDGRTTVPYASDAICTLFRITLDDVRDDASKLFEIIHPDDFELVRSSIQESARKLTPWDCQFRVLYEDKSMRWLQGSSLPQLCPEGETIWHGFISDVTTHKRDEEILRNSERFLSTLTDVIPGLLSYWDINLICTFANREYLAWFGKSRDEMIGTHLRDLLGDELFKKDEPYIRNALNGHGAHFERILNKNASEPHNIWVNYMPDSDGDDVRGFYVLVTDITELKQAQSKLEELNSTLKQRSEEAEQASLSKSRLLATVAHEFRTPLSLLTSSTDILDRYGERLSAEEHTQQHEHIRNAARQMSALVDSVLSFNHLDTKSNQNKAQQLDIAIFCKALASEIKTSHCAGHLFTVSIADNCGSAMLDEQLIRRVVENLLSNAFRYTAAGGTVSFQVRRTCDLLNIEISDSGIGIPQECQQQIFEAFYRGRNVEMRRGLGLGLSIVHDALNALGGNIVVRSTLGKGTDMLVEIPVIEPVESKEG